MNTAFLAVTVGTSERLLTLLSDAYFCADEVDGLATVDDIPLLKNLQVPHELYTCARTSRAREAAIRSHNNPVRVNREASRIQPPFSYHSRSEDMERRSSSGSDSTGRERSSSPDASLAPLEYLESLPRSAGRHPMDDRVLRLFDSAGTRDV